MNTHHHILDTTGRPAQTLRTRFQGFLFLLLTGLALAIATAAADPPKDWRWLLPSQPLPSPFHSFDVDFSFGNGRFVGVGGSGGVITSPDGLNWTPVLPGTFDYFSSVTFDGVKFVACVGRSSGTSSDGMGWEFHLWTGVHDADYFDVIDYLGGMFVGIGENSAANAAVLYTSADGIHWTRRLRIAPSSPNAYVFIEGVAHGNGRFVLLGGEFDHSSGEESLESFTYTSLDGNQWTQNLLPEADTPYPIAHGEAGFMVADNGRILVSPDGKNWEVRHVLTQTEGSCWYSRGIATIGNRIVCYFQQQTVDEFGNWSYTGHLTLASEDGISWQETPLPWTPTPHGSAHEKLISANSTFLLYGTDSVLSSPDGIVWTERFTPHPLSGTASLYDVVYGDHGFVAVGMGGTVLASADGLVWERRASGTARYLSSVVYGQGRYVASGGRGTIIHSPDGQTWTSSDLEGVNLGLHQLSYGAGRFVVATPDIDTGVVWTSEDGINWQIRSSLALQFLYGIQSFAFGNGRFVATGLHHNLTNGIHSAVSYSEDGITWQRVALPAPYTTTKFLQLIFDGVRFLALDQSKVLLTSPDGVTWTPLNEGRYSAIGFGGGGFVALRAVAENWEGDAIFLLESSPDGSSWTTASPPPLRFSSGGLKFAYGAGRFVGVGSTYDNTARLLVSGFIPPLALPQLDLRIEAARMMLRIRGNAGTHWTLQRSSTLQDWETVGPVTLGTTPLELDVTPSTGNQGFWRLAAPNQ